MNFLTLDLNLLRVFDVVMVEQNLTRAADKLAMTQPAVSNALKRLRQSLGDELLIRTAYGVNQRRGLKFYGPPYARHCRIWKVLSRQVVLMFPRQRQPFVWRWRTPLLHFGCQVWYAPWNVMRPA